MLSVSARAVSVRVHLDAAASPARAATGSRLRRPERRRDDAPVSGIAAATDRVAASSRAPNAAGGAERDAAPGRRRGARKASGKSRMPLHVGAAEGVDRLVGVAEGDEVAAVARPSACSSRTWAGSVSWYSSTKTAS